jgi:RNA polymerase sigma factor (sigma-70 family)
MDQRAAPAQSDPVMVPDRLRALGFSEFVAPHWTAMARLSARLSNGHGGEDILQDASTTAWRTRAKFDTTRGTARTWLLAITADQARKARRTSRRHARNLAIADPTSDEPFARDIDIERAIRRLTDRQQLAINLYYYVGLPIAEVAAVMRCADGTVKSTLADARARLRQDLGEDFV